MRHIRSSDIKIAVGIFTFFGIVFFVIKGRDGGDKKDYPPALVVPITTTELEVAGEQLDVGEKKDQKPVTMVEEKSPPVLPPISTYQAESILFTDFDRGTPP
ncbi:MAG TPA: hypothetical protein VI752_01985 [Candidatus Paceibacterota bacterium]